MVKIHSQLSQASLNQGKDRYYAIWLLLRCLDQRSSKTKGWVSVKQAIQFFTLVMDFSKTSIYRQLKEGNHEFWALECTQKYVRQRVIRIFSLKAVSEKLDVYHLGRPQIIPLDEFLGGLQKRRSCLWASAFSSSKKVRPIARESLQEKVGVDRRTQVRYEKVGPKLIQKRRNFGVYRDQDSELKRPDKFGGQIANSYRSLAEAGSRSFTKKVNKCLCEPFEDKAKGNFRRRYFYKAKEFARTASANKWAPISYLWVATPYRVCKGHREWEAILTI